MRSPNDDLKLKNNRLNSPFELGENHILKRFRAALKILLSSEYYEGTELGKIYNEVDANGKSKIYISQPTLEKKLQEEFLDEEGDITKYLVGYTGVGKTTLIRNFFGIFNRDIIEKDDNLIIYLSFYAMVADGKSALKNSIIEVMELACTYLSEVDYLERLKSYDDDYYKQFYRFIYDHNNKLIIHSYPNSPKYTKNIDNTDTDYKKILDHIAKKNPLDYALSQLKYNLYRYKERTKKHFDNIIFIFDDIEAKPMKYQNQLIEIVYHIKKCLQAYEHRSFSFKTIITLRNYSFRLEQIRAKAAFREIDKSDIILKSSIPDLSEVIEKRFQYALQHESIISQSVERQSYIDAKNELDIILKKLYGQYDKMLLSLTHNNIFESMNLLMRILTNKKYIGKYEKETDGSFILSENDYNLYNYNDMKGVRNADVFYALVYGENDTYIDRKDYYLTNIMHFKSEEQAPTEVLGLYVIQYLAKRGLCMADASYDGLKTITGKKVAKEIIKIFDRQSDADKLEMKKGIKKAMKHLYEGGALLQSIWEPKCDEKEYYTRNYTSDKQIYLSLRGIQLYNMLSANSLLFEVYRDDIDTEIENNDKISMTLSKTKRIEYCLIYAMHIFGKEAEYIRNCSQKENFENAFGDELVTYILLNGIRQSINIYYRDNIEERKYLSGMFNQYAKFVNEFIEDTLVKNGTTHKQIQCLVNDL